MSGTSDEGEAFASQATRLCAVLARGFAGLVNESEGRDTLPSLGKAASSVATRCQRQGLQAAADLADALARGCGLLFDGQLDPGQAILLLASGTETLRKSILAQVSSQRVADADRPLHAARYELETLFPIQDQAPRPNKGGPDVMLHRLRKR